MNRDDPAREAGLRALIAAKPALRRWYTDVYERFAARLAACPAGGTVLELGSGPGFIKDVIPEAVTSDVIPYPGVDLVADAAKLPFPDRTLRAVILLNVFHHLPDAAAFLREAQRCLAPGGRVLILDQHRGWISEPILRWAHHETYDPAARDWAFASVGPLSGANGALAWIVFERDRARLASVVPGLHLERHRPVYPLSYWLAGGLKSWSLLPGAAFGAARAVDGALAAVLPRLGSFVEIDLVRTA